MSIDCFNLYTFVKYLCLDNVNHFSQFFSDLNAGNSLEIQEKLERLNQIMSEDWQRFDPSRRMFHPQSKTS